MYYLKYYISGMKTYKDSGYEYFYDRSIGSWTIYGVDENGCQISSADYHNRKSDLLDCYPQLKFNESDSN